MSDCPNCLKLQAELELTRKQLAIRLDRDGFLKMASVAFGANMLPHRNMQATAIRDQCFQWAQLWWEGLQADREKHKND